VVKEWKAGEVVISSRAFFSTDYTDFHKWFKKIRG